MKKINIIIYLVFLNSSLLLAQNNFFKIAENKQLSNKRTVLSTIKKNQVYSLDENAMRSYLLNAPMEFKNNGKTIPLEIPLPDGTIETFNVVESPILSSEIAAQNPDIKTYSGNGTKNTKATLRLSLTSAGFNAIILNVGNDAVYFESYSTERSNIYFNYFSKDAKTPDGQKAGSCLQEPESQDGHEHDNLLDKKKVNDKTSKTQGVNVTNTSVGTQLRTFRLAIAATGEFTASNGGTAASGLAAIVSYVNRINAVFRNELSVNLSLVSGTNLIYTDAANDPYAQTGNLGPQLSINHNNLNAVLGASNYDIGHLIGFESGSGQGLAAVRSLCDQNNKGRALSFVGTVSSYGLSFMDNLILHEMGHQFGMSHSYNSTTNVCTTRREATSVEPGAGTTIMSYGYICGTDNYPEGPIAGTLLQYHSVNYEESVAFLSTISCQVSTSTTNIPPVVTVPTGYTIPKSTPFVLTGSATDANNDNLTYCWEGTNIGTIVPDATTLDDTTQPPFFRTYPASASPSRTYPSLTSILDGTNQAKGDKLPSIGTVTNHTLTVRDNNSLGGGVTNARVTVTIDGNTGPFLETTNLAGLHNSLSSKTITWSVNGTNVSTPTINILLSTDGGYTFPTTLASNTPNDGSQVVTLPNISTKTARIKIEAIGNVFFDISNVNFTIEQPLAAIVNGSNVTTAGGSDGTATVNGFGGKITFDYNLKHNFTSNPYNITTTKTTFSTISIPALPSGVVINSVSLNFTNVFAIGTSWSYDILASLTGVYTLSNNRFSTLRKIGLLTPDPIISLPNFPIGGGTLNLLFQDDYKDNTTTAEATIASAFINVNYTKNGYTYLWSNGATTPKINSLSPGVYTVTVTDASGATTTGSYTVTEPTNFSILASSDDNGTISSIGTTSVISGESKTYTFTPNSCYQISDVLIDGVSIGAVSNHTFTNVLTNHTISVSFTSISSFNTTTATNFLSYTWANNGQTYTSSGIKTGTTTNCVTELLDLTITTTQIPTTFPAFCKGATVATAIGNTGIKFYLSETGGLPLAGTTALSNARTYFVSEMINNVESSPRVARTIIVNPIPATPASMTTTDAVLCKYVGTINIVTYTVAAVPTATAYLWSVPAGANVITDASAKDNVITVNFLNAPLNNISVGGLGTISARAVNSFDCPSLPRSLVLTAKLPTAPTKLEMTSSDSIDHFNKPVSGSFPIQYTFSSLADLTTITKVGPYMGSSTVFTLTAPVAPTAASYEWTLPLGTTQLSGTTSNKITVDFAGVPAGIGSLPILVKSVGGCGKSSARTLTLSRTVPGAPTALTLTNSSQPNLSSLSKITKIGPYTGTSIQFTLTATPFLTQGATSTSYAWILPAGVTCETTSTPITVLQRVAVPITIENPTGFAIQSFDAIETPTNIITVNFLAVSGTGNLDLLVFGINGAGNSIARKLVLARALPTAPTALVLRDGATVVNRVGPYIGESTSLTLTATPYLTQGAEATLYKWTLPAGVNVTTGATLVSGTISTPTTWTSTGTVLTIDFEGVATGVFTLPLSIQAVNGAGTSATTRTLTVISAAPTMPGSITTPTLAVPTYNPACPGTRTITVQVPSVFGVTYSWTVGAGASITAGQGTNLITIDVETVTTTTLAISVIGSNGTGSSAARTLTIKKVASCREEASSSIANEFSVIAYPNPSSSEFTIKSSAKGAIIVKVYDMQGRLVEKTNTDKVGARLAAGAYNVIVNQGANVKTLRVIKK